MMITATNQLMEQNHLEKDKINNNSTDNIESNDKEDDFDEWQTYSNDKIETDSLKMIVVKMNLVTNTMGARMGVTTVK